MGRIEVRAELGALPLDSHMTSRQSFNALFCTGGIIFPTVYFLGGYWEE